MKLISNIVHGIDEELSGAQNYAEKMVESKASGNSKWAQKYKSMAEDELSHAMNLHELAVEEIEKLRSVMTPPQDMLDKWNVAHVSYVDKAAWIKQMMSC